MAITKPSAWSPGHTLAAILPLLVILAIAAVSLRAQPPATSADPDFVHALYIVKVDRVVKLKAADGTSLFEITDVQELRRADADEHHEVFWVYAQNTLRAYGFDGQFLFSAPVPPPEPGNQEDELSRIGLRVNSNNGSVWLGKLNQLHHFDAQGQLLQSIALTQNVRALTFDPSTDRVWVATDTAVSAYEDTGALVNIPVNLGANPELRDIDVDADARYLWVALKNRLRRHDLDTGALQLSKNITNLKKVASDSQGGAWFSANRALGKLDATGSEIPRRTPFARADGNIVALAADPVDLSVWAATKTKLKHIDAAGTTLLTQSFPLPRIRDLVLYRDTIPPELSFTSPAEGAVLNTATPALGLSYSDVGTGVDTSTLVINANGAVLNVNCTFGAVSATCTPTTSLAGGATTLSATIQDFAGNLSNTATVNFTVDINQPPVAVDDAATTTESTPVDIVVLGNDSDPDNDPLAVTAFTQGANGTVTFAANVATYTPAAGFSGSDSFDYTISDGQGGSATATVTVTVNPPPTGNQRPVLNLIGNQTVALGTSLTLQLSATDPNGDPLSFSAVPLPLPANAGLNAATGVFTFAPQADQVGDIALTFIVSDGSLTDSEAITITVQGASPGGVTALTGRLLDTNAFVAGQEVPVVGAAVSLLSTGFSATSDSAGNFALSGLPAGSQVLDIATANANPAPDGSAYAGFREEIDLIANVTNTVERPFFLPRIAQESLTPVDPNTTTVVTNPTLNVTMTVPPNTAKNPDGTNFTGELSISEVPEGMAPAALPSELQPGLIITIQPVGVTFATPVPVTFPNIDNLAPGSETDLWSLDAGTGKFVVVGKGQVSADGAHIETISGGIRAADWHMVLPPAAGGNTDNDEHSEDNQANNGQCPVCRGATTVSSQRGTLTRDPTLPSHRSLGISRSVEFIYNSLSADPRPVLPFDTTVLVQAAVPPTLSYSLEVGGIQQGTEIFVDTSGLNENQDETIRNAVQFDASTYPTGRYPVTLKLTSNYTSSRISSTVLLDMLVTNEQASPFGAGWSLKGVHRLHQDTAGNVVITEGDGSIRFFRFSDIVSGRIAYWPFDDGVDPTADITGGHNGDLIGPTFTSADIAPIPENVSALSFDGVDDYVGVANASDLNPVSAITVAAWINPSSHVGSFDPIVKKAGEGLGQINGYALEFSGSNAIFWVYISGTGWRSSASAFVPSNAWTHVAGIYDGSGISLYINGASVGSPASISGSIVPSGNDLNIGRDPANPSRLYRGLIDDVQIYNRALTAAELTALATGTAGSATSGLVAPPGDFSTLGQNPDGTFTRTLRDGTKINFSAAGLHTSTVDRNGNTTTYAYDAEGRLSTITDPRGRVTTFSYTGGLLSSVTDPAGRVTSFTHDGAGNLTEIAYPDGSTESFKYDARHLLEEQTNPREFVTTHEYDVFGRFMRTLEPDSSTRALSGSQLVGLVDTSGGLGSETNPAPVLRPEAALAHYTDGKLNATVLKTDSLGNITLQTDALTRTTTIVRDPDGLPTQITRPNGAVTTMTYDTRGNLLTSTEQAINATTTFTYEPSFNQVSSITDPNGNKTTINYDAKGNPIEILDAKGTRTGLSYTDPNCPGQLTSVTSAAGLAEDNTTSFAYDPATCNLVQTTDPLGNTTALAYDAAGNVIQSTDGEGRVTRFRYDAMNRLTKVIDSTNADPDPACGIVGVTCYTYDPNGNLSGVTDARGNMTSFEYDSMDHLETTRDPLGNPETFAYDGNGNLLSTLDRKGQTIGFEYDAVNQLINKTLPGNLVTGFAYDAVGNLTEVTDPDSKLTLGYDLANRLISASTAGSPNQPEIALSYAYDKNGNRLTLADTTGATSYAYDSLNRLDTLTNPAGQLIGFDYDALSRRTQTTLPNGTTASFAYDPASQLLDLINTAAAATLSKYTYAYDKVGNRNQVDQQRSAVAVLPSLAYEYDGLNRLVRAAEPPVPPGTTVESYNYDPVGNRLRRDGQSVDAIFDAANRLVEDELTCYTYDLNGNLTQRIAKTIQAPGACGSVATIYTYDAENRLTRIDFSGGTFAEYRYDGLGRRIEKNDNGSITRYVYDNEDILLEFDGANTLLARYTHGPGIDEPLILERDVDGSGAFEDTERFSYHADGLGSVTELTASTGAVARAYVYDSFGQIMQQAGTVSNSYTYTGREFDAESGLYYYRARYYDARLGRFISPDPAGIRERQNLYVYVGSNPINFIDPLGQRKKKTSGDLVGRAECFAFCNTQPEIPGPICNQLCVRLVGDPISCATVKKREGNCEITFTLCPGPGGLPFGGGDVSVDPICCGE